MPNIRVHNRRFDIDAIVFDKDGTLIDFHCIWSTRARSGVSALAAHCGGGEALEHELLQAFGYDLQTQQVHAAGPFATAPLDKIYTVAATVLYRHGHPWLRAESQVAEVLKPLLTAPPPADSIRPLIPLPPFLDGLIQHGIQIVIATSDNRVPTEAQLRLMQIADRVKILACGDDNTFPQKPDPALLHTIAAQLDTTCNRLMMVSDTDTDMLMADNATAAAIAVLSGAGTAEQLRPCADVVVDDVGEICVA